MATSIIQGEYQSLIFEIRGYKVMIGTDLAALDETETKVLKQQVRRNIDRFPQDFMFQLAKEEKAIKINIEIMRAFSVYRAMLIEDKSLRKEIKALDEKINKVFRYMLDRIDALHQVEATPRKKIGYKDYENG